MDNSLPLAISSKARARLRACTAAPGFRSLGTAVAVCALVALAACEKVGGPKPEDALPAARTSLAAKDFNSAMIHLRNAASRDPGNAEVRLLLGETLWEVGDPANAVVELRKARELKADDNRVVPPLAESLLAIGQDKVLVEQLGAVSLSNSEAQARLLSTLALTFYGQGRAEKARELIAAGLQRAPDNRDLLLAAARIAAADGDTAKALADAEQILRKHPDLDAALTFKGLMLSRSGARERAAEAYEAALKANPRQLEALFSRGMLAVAAGDTKTARAMASKLGNEWPSNPNTAYLNARILYLEGRYAEASPIYTRLLALAPENLQTLLAAGTNDVQLGNLIQAEAHFAKAVTLVPQSAESRLLLSQVQLRLARPDKAWISVAPIVEAKTANSRTLVVGAQARLMLGDTAGSEQLFRRAAAIGAEDAETKTALAASRLGVRGQEESAMQELRQLAQSSTSTEPDMRIISTLLSQKRLDESLKAIDALEKKTPKSPSGSELRGQVFLAKGDKAAARQSFEQSLQIDATYVPAISQLTALDLEQKALESARSRVNSALTKAPNNGNLLSILATLQLKAGAPSSEVLQTLERAVRSDPLNLNTWMMLLMRHYNAGDYGAAIGVAQEANKAIPENVQIMDITGRIQIAAGNLNQAVQTYADLIKAAPQSAAGYIGQMSAFFAARDLDSAAKVGQRLMDIDRSSPIAMKMVAEIAIARRRFDEALTLARRMQATLPKLAAGHIVEGAVAEAQGQTPKAVAAYRKALTLSGLQDTPVRLHQVLLRSEDKAAASAFAKEWLSQHPRDAQFMVYLGDVDQDLSNPSGAVGWYERALQLEPTNFAALNNCANAWLARQDPDKALGFAQKAVAQQPNRPEALETLSQVHVAKKQYAEAAATLRKAIARATNPAPLQISLAKALVASGDKASAAAELQLVLDKGKSHPSFAEARKMLTSIRQSAG